MDTNQKRRVRYLASKGHTIPEIAARMGIRQQRIERFCLKHEIVTQRVHGRLPTSLAEIRRMVAKLGSVDQAATHYGVTRQAVYYRLNQGN